MSNTLKQIVAALGEQAHEGISHLRTMNASKLRELGQVTVLHDHAKPIAVIMPYALFMAARAAYIEANKRLLSREEK